MIRDSRHRARILSPSEGDPDRLQNLLEFAHGIQSKDPGGVTADLERLAQRAQSATMGAGAAIAISRQNQLECIARSGAVAPQLGSHAKAAAGLCGECTRTGLPQFCTDAETDPRVNRVDAESIQARSILYVPLFHGVQAVGVLGVFSDRKCHFTQRDLRVLKSIGREVTRALHWHPKSDAVIITSRVDASQYALAPAVRFGKSSGPDASASTNVPQPQPSETPQLSEREAHLIRSKPRTKPGDVLTLPVAEESKPFRLGTFLSLLTVLILAGTGIGYLVALWTQGHSSRQTNSQSASTAASSATIPVTVPKLAREVIPASEPSGTPAPKTVPAATNPLKTAKTAHSAIYLESVRARVLPGRTLVSLQLTGQTEYQVHTLTNPDRIYVDLQNVTLKNGLSSVPASAAGAVRLFRVGTGHNSLRVVMDLASPCIFVVRSTDPSAIEIEIRSDRLAAR